MMPAFAAKADTTALKQALIQACIGNVKFVDHLQVMGVLCVSVDDEPLEIVVKVNDLLQKRPSAQLQDKTGELIPRGGKPASGGAAGNRAIGGFGAPTGNSARPQAGGDSTKQNSNPDVGKQRSAADSSKPPADESDKQTATETGKSADVADGQATGSTEPKRMRIITVGDEASKQKTPAKPVAEDTAADKDGSAKQARSGAAVSGKEGSGGDDEFAALQLLALKASRSSPSIGSQAKTSGVQFNNSQPNSDTGVDGSQKTIEYEPESLMQVDYDVELEVDGSTKPKESNSPVRCFSPNKTRSAVTSSYVLRVGSQDRRSAGQMQSPFGASQKPVTLLAATYGGDGLTSKVGVNKRGSVGMKQAGSIEVYNCAECGATFAMRRDLRMHVARTAHKPFKCPECARLFKDWQGLEGHALKHIGAKPWTCARCQRAYYSRPATLCHIETVHAVELEMEAQKYAQYGGQSAFGVTNSYGLGSSRSRNRKGAAGLHSQTQVQALIKRIAYDATTKQFLAKLRRANMTAIPATRNAVARAFTDNTMGMEDYEADVKLESELDFVASNTELGGVYDEEVESGDDTRGYEYYDEDDEGEEESAAYEEDEDC